MRLRSTKGPAGIVWPALFFGADAEVLAVLCQLLISERWPAERMREAQGAQLASLLQHAMRTVPWHAQRLQLRDKAAIDRVVGDAGRWRELPILTREDVRAYGKELRSDDFSQTHGRAHVKSTSGTTGQPVEVLLTDVTQRMWEAIALRDHAWNQRDAGLSYAVVRALTPSAPPPDGKRFETWGYPYERLWQTGPSFMMDMVADVKAHATWLRRVQPAYLTTYPTIAAALLEEFEQAEKPPIREIVCVGEPVTPEFIARAREVLGARVSANYTSNELGYMGLLCPDCGQYHVQSESVLLEVIDDDGAPCAPGETGRVIVTSLHNFATPLIRYEIGDYAEVGGPCPGGRTLPSLRRILGRRRNMLIHPDGKRHWPMTGFARYNEVAPIKQYQLVQHTRQEVEVRLVAQRTLTQAELAALGKLIHTALGYPFTLRFTQHEGRLDRGAGGKFEEFLCLAT